MKRLAAALTILFLALPAFGADSFLILVKKPMTCADARHLLAKEPVSLLCGNDDEKVRAFSATLFPGQSAEEVLRRIQKKKEVDAANMD